MEKRKEGRMKERKEKRRKKTGKRGREKVRERKEKTNGLTTSKRKRTTTKEAILRCSIAGQKADLEPA